MDNNEEPRVDTEMPEGNHPIGMEPESHAMGPIIGTVIIVALLVLGGLYFWGSQLFDTGGTGEPTAEEIQSSNDPIVENLNTQASSDSVGSIEADLKATELDNLDADLQNVGAELSP